METSVTFSAAQKNTPPYGGVFQLVEKTNLFYGTMGQCVCSLTHRRGR